LTEQLQNGTMGYFFGFKLHIIINMITGLLAYSFLPKKPSISVDVVDEKQLVLF
jgi:hypothetical protein